MNYKSYFTLAHHRYDLFFIPISILNDLIFDLWSIIFWKKTYKVLFSSVSNNEHYLQDNFSQFVGFSKDKH